MNLKKFMNTIAVSIMIASPLNSMEFRSLDTLEKHLVVPVVVGTSFVGGGLWMGIESYLGIGSYATIIDETIKKIEIKKGFDQSVAMVSLGVSLFMGLSSYPSNSLFSSIIK